MAMSPPEVDICRCDVVQALVVTLVVVVIDEGFEIARQEVVFQQDAVVQSLMPTFDLTLGLRMIRRTAAVLHAVALQPLSQFL